MTGTVTKIFRLEPTKAVLVGKEPTILCHLAQKGSSSTGPSTSWFIPIEK